MDSPPKLNLWRDKGLKTKWVNFKYCQLIMNFKYLYGKLTDNIEVYVTTDYNMSKKSG